MTEPTHKTSSSSAGSRQTLGAVQAWERDEATVTFRCANGLLQITALADDCFRVRAKPGTDDFEAPFSYAVAKDAWADVEVTVEEDNEIVVIQTGGASCRVSRAGAGVRFEAGDRLLCADIHSASMTWQGESLALHKQLATEEAIYGLGQRAFGLNLRGRRYALWNFDPALYDRGDDPAYYSIPFYVTAGKDGRAYGLFFDNSYRGYIDTGKAVSDQLTVSLEGGELRYYVFTGPHIADVMARYTELTGRMSLPPWWAIGYHQCRWSYYPEARVREIAGEFRKRGIPCDAIYLDIDYMDGFRCFTWDPAHFPDPAGLIRDLHADGFRVVVMIDPGIKVDETYAVDQSGIERDIFLKDADGELCVAAVWPGPCHFPDFTKPAARAWWAEQYESLMALGVDGVWNDMNEPTTFEIDPETGGFATGTLPDDAQHDWEGRGASHLAAHNVYGLLMARSTREALDKLRPGKRQLVICRAPYAGAQRYTSSWTGDNKSEWDHLALSVSMCLNLGLSGMAFTGPDIGGFGGEPTGEMVTRWFQLASCLPYFRMHTVTGTPDQEPWSFGQPYEDINRRYIQFRYELLPYIYTAFAQCARDGMPVVRPVAMVDPTYPNLDDQFMLGDQLMVAPVMAPQTNWRRVFIPAAHGVWYDFWSGARVAGGHEAYCGAPLTVLPLYAKAGAAIPMWPPVQHTGELPADTLRLRVFAGSGQTEVYEDAGEGEPDPAGWSTIHTQLTPQAFELTWERQPGAKPAYKHIDVTVLGLLWVPNTVSATIDGKPVEVDAAEGGMIKITGAPAFDTLRIEPGDPNNL